MIPITKLFIKFDVHGNTPYPIITNKRPLKGSAVNFLEILNFDVAVPASVLESDLIFSPTLTIYLYDTIFGGVSDRMIGLATLDLREKVKEYLLGTPKNRLLLGLSQRLTNMKRADEDVNLTREKDIKI